MMDGQTGPDRTERKGDRKNALCRTTAVMAVMAEWVSTEAEDEFRIFVNATWTGAASRQAILARQAGIPDF